jgi:hypothetical protein
MQRSILQVSNSDELKLDDREYFLEMGVAERMNELKKPIVTQRSADPLALSPYHSLLFHTSTGVCRIFGDP